MAEVLILNIIPRETGPEIELIELDPTTEQVLRILSQSGYCDKMIMVCVRPNECVDIMAHRMVMARQMHGSRCSQVRVVHNLPETFWQILYIELLHDISEVPINPLLIEIVEVEDLINA